MALTFILTSSKVQNRDDGEMAQKRTYGTWCACIHLRGYICCTKSSDLTT